MMFPNVQEHLQDDFSILLDAIVLFHTLLQVLFESFTLGFGRLEYLVVRGRDRLSLEEGHHVGRGSVGNGEIQRRVVVVILLMRSFGISLIQCFHDFEWSVVVRRVVQGQIAVIVLLGGALGVDLEE